MDSSQMDRSRGTKWFTFYTKVRPWLACINALPVIMDFFQYVDAYASCWWLMLYFLGEMAQVVLAIMVFVKSRGDYQEFVRFVNGVLWFETIDVAYNQGVRQYIRSGFDIVVALAVAAVIFALGFFVWYGLNIKYFRKRLLVSEYAVDNTVVTQSYTANLIPEGAKTVFCRKCGAKLLDGARFCDKCGTEVIESGE